jgi:hypothetical protein
MGIGIDFDNTLINYDGPFVETARAWGLLQPKFSGTKRDVRDAIRRQPQGELAWQRLQGYVYGRGIADAVLFPGAGDFLERCRRDAKIVFIISHKTSLGHFDPAGVNLHQAALDWMQHKGFFSAHGFGLNRERVFFEPSREAKLARIAALNCSVFIDDLEEVLSAPSFPANVRRILFGSAQAFPLGTACPTWPRVETAIFDSHE